MSALTILAIVGGLCAAIAGMGGIVGVVLLWGKQTAMASNIVLLSTANTEVRAENAELRRLMERERLDCARDIANLRGQIEALTGNLGERIIVAAAAAAEKVASAAATAADDVIATAAAVAHSKEM
jgi:hypothetical protein